MLTISLCVQSLQLHSGLLYLLLNFEQVYDLLTSGRTVFSLASKINRTVFHDTLLCSYHNLHLLYVSVTYYLELKTPFSYLLAIVPQLILTWKLSFLLNICLRLNCSCFCIKYLVQCNVALTKKLRKFFGFTLIFVNSPEYNLKITMMQVCNQCLHYNRRHLKVILFLPY